MPDEISAAPASKTHSGEQHGMMGDVKRALGPLCGLPALGQSAKTNHNTVYQTATGTDVTLNATLTSLCRMWPLLFFLPFAAVRVRAHTCVFFTVRIRKTTYRSTVKAVCFGPYACLL